MTASQPTERASEREWPMRVENGLAAHFKQPDGSSRPGVTWLVAVKHGTEIYKVRVKALLADDANAATRRNEKYQAETAMQYLAGELNRGWHPSQEREHTIHIGNPLWALDESVPPAKTRPWWKFW